MASLNMVLPVMFYSIVWFPTPFTITTGISVSLVYDYAAHGLQLRAETPPPFHYHYARTPFLHAPPTFSADILTVTINGVTTKAMRQ